MGCVRRRIVCNTGSIYFHDKYIKKSAANRQIDDRSVHGDTAECCSVSDISIQCYFTPLIPVEESIQIATAPYLVLFQLRSIGILCRVCRTTWRHTKDRNLCLSRCYVTIPSAMVVLNSTKSGTVGNFRSFVLHKEVQRKFETKLYDTRAQHKK